LLHYRKYELVFPRYVIAEGVFMPRAKITLSNAELVAELRRRQKKLPKLQNLAAQLEQKLAAVRAEIAALSGALAPVSANDSAHNQHRTPAATLENAKPVRRPRNKMSLAEALISVLDKNEPKSVKTIIAEIKASGYKTTSANFDTIVHQTIARERKRIEKVGRGLYKLKS
jgi:septal ring factor EnvC (AmiA/AmiB activator)